jgi:predicted dehydrogenase
MAESKEHTMATESIGIILSGVTGRMGTNQHLVRSILAIMQQGGLDLGDGRRLMPRPLLVGRSAHKLERLAETHGPPVTGAPLDWTTDLDAALQNDDYPIFFDASSTLQRVDFVKRAVQANKAIYCEKPSATTTAEALELARLCEQRGVKNGVVQDKLWLPGMRKLAMLKQQGFFGRMLSVRGEFGYWVFTGHVDDQPAQRPSWNYRAEDGGGIMIDMFCHFRYVIDNLFGPVKRVVALGSTDMPERIDENGRPYQATADDAAYGLFELDNGIICQINSAWTTRVRRDDLFTLQVDGSAGTAVAGLRECWVQHQSETPKPVWNPDIPQPVDLWANWQQTPNTTSYDNAFKIQWEQFLRHYAQDAPFPWTLREGAKGVQLAEAGMQSWRNREWVTLEALDA